MELVPKQSLLSSAMGNTLQEVRIVSRKFGRRFVVCFEQIEPEVLIFSELTILSRLCCGLSPGLMHASRHLERSFLSIEEKLN